MGLRLPHPTVNRSVGISSEIAAPVLEALTELGLASDTLLPAYTTVLAQNHLRHEMADSGLDVAAALLSDDAVGLTVASRIPVGVLGVLDYALCTSSVLRDGLRRLVRYYGIATQRSTLRLVVDPPRALLVVGRGEGISYGRHGVEFALAMIAQRMRQTLGVPVAFNEVAFAHGPPAATSRHEEFFGTRVRFSSPPDRLVFASELLDLPLRTAASALAELLEIKLRELAMAAHADALLVRTHEAVGDLLDAGDIALDSLAQRLALSRRSLQRELRARGTSHREILHGIRRERALGLLALGTLSVEEVAAELAFTDASAFYRAFRRWTNTSPGALRRTDRRRR